MKRFLVLPLLLALGTVPGPSEANLLTNGNLDLTAADEINPPAPGFFLPKPQDWTYDASNAISGLTRDGMSSEPWAGPPPTPATTDGNANPPHPEGCGGPDCAAFFKPFAGNTSNGAITAHLYQNVAATAGVKYTLTAWAGAEQNVLAGVELALEFFNAALAEIASAVLDVVAAGLLTDNGEPFDYKQYTLFATAPAGTASVRVRASMIDGVANPQGGGQALVFDDFELTSDLRTAPEPAALGLLGLGLAGLGLVTRRRRVA
jgi:hypothetical protein